MTRQEIDTIIARVTAVDAAARVIAEGNLYIEQIINGSTIDPAVIIIMRDDGNVRHTMTVNATMPDIIARMPGALKMHGWAWL